MKLSFVSARFRSLKSLTRLSFIAVSLLLVTALVFTIIFINQRINHESDTEIQEKLAKSNPDFSEFLTQYKDDHKAEKEESSVLIYAIKNEKTEFAKLLIESGVNIDKKNKYDRTALELALIRSNTELVRLLLSMGAKADMNESIGYKSSYLSLAAERNDAELIHLLIDNGAEIDVTNSDNDFALRVAVENLAKDSVQALLKRGADVNFTRENEPNLFFALIERERKIELTRYVKENKLKIKIADILLKAGADLNAKFDNYQSLLDRAMKNNLFEIEYLILKSGFDFNDKKKAFRNSYLIHAILGKSPELAKNITAHDIDIPIQHPELAKLFIEKGADINAKLDDNNTLTLALLYNQPDVAKILIERGIDLNHKNKFGETALMLALDKNYTDVAQLLIEKGADINIVSNSGDTALTYAIFNKHTATVKLLIDKGSKTNIKVEKEKTPLSYAVLANEVDIAKILIAKGADVNKSKLYDPINPDGTGLLFYSFIKEYHDMSRLLVNSGYELNKLSVNGDTPLIQSLYIGSYDLVQLLIKKGADVNMKTDKGECPLSIVYKRGNTQLQKLLEKHGATCVK